MSDWQRRFFGRILVGLAFGGFTVLLMHFKLRDFEASGYFALGMALSASAALGFALYYFLDRHRPD